MLTATETYCVKLYADAPSLVKGLFEPNPDTYLDARQGIEDLVDTAAPNADWLGASGATTTYDIAEADMPNLLSAIQTYNNSKQHQHIIHIELY